MTLTLIQRGRARAEADPAAPAQPEGVPFLFGYAYTHFFYAVEAHAPWRTVAAWLGLGLALGLGLGLPLGLA